MIKAFVKQNHMPEKREGVCMSACIDYVAARVNHSMSFILPQSTVLSVLHDSSSRRTEVFEWSGSLYGKIKILQPRGCALFYLIQLMMQEIRMVSKMAWRPDIISSTGYLKIAIYHWMVLKNKFKIYFF